MGEQQRRSYRRQIGGDLTNDERRVCRQAVGDELIGVARILRRFELEDSPEPIPLPLTVQNDLIRSWLDERLSESRQLIEEFEAEDFHDPVTVGRQARGKVRDLLDDAAANAELASFLIEFGAESIGGLYAVLTEQLIRRAALAVLVLAVDAGPERLEIQADYRAARADAQQFEDVIGRLRNSANRPIGSPLDVIAAALGEQPLRPIRGTYYDLGRAYGATRST